MSPPPADNEAKGSMGTPRTDLLLLNARVLDPHAPPSAPSSIRQAVAIGGGSIISVGPNDEVSASARPASRIIDCNGLTLVPGLVDSHCHLLTLASTLRGLDCGPQAASSISALQQLVRSRAGLTPPGGWIRGFGYDDSALAESRHPTRWDLDQVASGHPVRLDHRSRHAAVLNSRGLELLGITSETPDPVEGVIDRDPASGTPTGLLLEMGDYLRRRLGAAQDQGTLQEGVRLLNQKLLAYGITSAHDAGPGNDPERWETFRELKASGQLSCRVTMMAGFAHIEEFRRAGLSFGDGDSGLRLGHAKIMVTRTTGALHPGVAELKGMVRQAHAAGFPVAIHAVEQEAVAAAAAALTGERESRGGLAVKDRIEHCSECPPELMAEVVQSGATIVTQPGFVYWQGDSYLANVDPGLHDHLYDAAGLHRAGASVAFGSDAPVIDPNPWPAIYSAVTRRTRSGASLGALTGRGVPAQKLPVRDALRMYTGGQAAAVPPERRVGITPGGAADLTLLDADPTGIDPERLKDIRSTMTIIGGRVEWEAVGS